MDEKKINEMQGETGTEPTATNGAAGNSGAANGGAEAQQPHKRRVRYKGTHPRHFSEKYKEHNPEKYADTIEKVIKPLLWYFAAIFAVLMLVTYVPQISLWLPGVMGYIK